MDVPSALAELPQWIHWRYKDSRKVPIDARTGRNAKSNDPQTWCDLATAQAQPDMSLGFVFAPEDGLFGVDLDGCISVDGELQAWALEILQAFNTYAEFSPSGTGIKLYGRGKMSGTGKKRNIDVEQVCSKAPGVEAYDRGRYFAFTGERLPECPEQVNDCQVALDAFCDRFWPKPKKASAATINFAPSPVGDIENRARLYLQSVPPAISKQGGHNQTFRAACVLVLGFGLPIDQAYPLLAEWNTGCQPPWESKDLWKKLSDANKREGERGFLLRSDGRYEGEDVDLRMLLANYEASETPQKKQQHPREFPADCLRVPGLIGEIMQWNLRTALYPQPELALAGAIALMATITGRKVQDDRGTRTNCYVLGLGLSGGGKEHARKINKELLIRSGSGLMNGPERIGSSAGMISYLSEHPATLFQLDEVARLLATMKNPGKSPHLYNVGTVLLQLYSASDSFWTGDAYADTKKIKAIYQPHCVIYGTSVPGAFWDSLTADNVTEGLLGRLMAFESPGYVPVALPVQEDAPEAVLEAVRWWVEFVPNGGNLQTENPRPEQATYTRPARKRMDEHLRAICERRVKESETEAAVWSRSGEKAGKLALIFACSRTRDRIPQVDLDDVDLAIKIANWLTRKMLQKVIEHVSENEHEAVIKKVLRKITGEITMSELTRRTQFLRDRRQRQEIVAHLIETGEIETRNEDTAGRSLTFFKRQNLEES